jgi:hypothetical protein
MYRSTPIHNNVFSCHNKSLSKLETITFEKDKITCNTKSVLSVACYNNIWKPSKVVCKKEKIDSNNNDYVVNSLEAMLNFWECTSYPGWVAAPFLKCPYDLSVCKDNAIEKCISVYNPADTLVYILIIIILMFSIFIVCLFLLATYFLMKKRNEMIYDEEKAKDDNNANLKIKNKKLSSLKPRKEIKGN